MVDEAEFDEHRRNAGVADNHEIVVFDAPVLGAGQADQVVLNVFG